MIELRCPCCGKLLAYISNKDKYLNYLQLKCCRCKREIFYSNGNIELK